MKRSMRMLPLGAALLALGSCEAVTGVAPEDTPRVEVELAVEVGEGFFEALDGVDADSELVSIVKQTVLEQADLGLRFYATPSEEYRDTDWRPPYLMTVRVDRLDVVLAHEMVEEDDEEPQIESRVDRVACALSARFERRRPNAPSLVVSRSMGESSVRAETDAEVIAAEEGFTPAFNDAVLKVLQKDIVRCVDRAAERALKSMRTPIDREFKGVDDKAAGAID